MGMGAEAAHGLGFTLYPGAGGLVQTISLDQRESHFPVQRCVVGQVTFFLPPSPRNLLTW
jgi:hypothetical protein